MNVVTSVAERAIWVVDHVLNRAMAYAWTATLQRQHSDAEDDLGGDLCSPEVFSGHDDLPLA